MKTPELSTETITPIISWADTMYLSEPDIFDHLAAFSEEVMLTRSNDPEVSKYAHEVIKQRLNDETISSIVQAGFDQIMPLAEEPDTTKLINLTNAFLWSGYKASTAQANHPQNSSSKAPDHSLDTMRQPAARLKKRFFHSNEAPETITPSAKTGDPGYAREVYKSVDDEDRLLVAAYERARKDLSRREILNADSLRRVFGIESIPPKERMVATLGLHKLMLRRRAVNELAAVLHGAPLSHPRRVMDRRLGGVNVADIVAVFPDAPQRAAQVMGRQ